MDAPVALRPEGHGRRAAEAAPSLVRPERHLVNRRVTFAAVLGVFVSLFPILIVIAALPDIAADLGTDEASLAWVLTVPLVISAGVLPICGRLGDLHGHRRVFLLGLATSAVFAALSAVAWSPLTLILFRSVSQAAGTAIGPSALALVISANEPAQRPKALGFWASAMALAPTLGLVTGGPLVALLSWRGLFVAQALIAVAVVPFAARSLRETPKSAHVTFDLGGAAAVMISSGALVFALDRSGRAGLDLGVLVALAVAVLAVIAFTRIEERTAEPILPPGLLRHRSFLASCTTELLIQVSTNGALIALPLLLTSHFDTGVAANAWLMAPMPLGMALTAPMAGRLTSRLGERTASILGMVLLGLAIVAMIPADGVRSLPALLMAWFVAGIANGIVRPAIASAAAASLEPADYGVGMAATRMISTVGGAAGIAAGVSLGAGNVALATCALVAFCGAVASRWLAASHPAPIQEKPLPRPGDGARSATVG